MSKCALCGNPCDDPVCYNCLYVLLCNVDFFLTKKKNAMPIGLLKQLVRTATEAMKNES